MNQIRENLKPKVALVGGRGFIGSQIARRLKENYELDIWELPDVDVRDPVLIAKKFSEFRPDAVINLAAVLGGVNSQNIKEIFDTNFVGTLNLLEQCVLHGVNHFILASSLTVHGSNDPKSPNILTSTFRPIHAYGASKAASEYVLQEYVRRFGLRAVALRPTIVLGDTPTPNAAVEFVRSFLCGEEAVIYGSGEHEREWIWIDDAALGFQRGLEFCLNAGPGYYPFFLSGNRITMKDLALKCAERLRGRVKFIPSSTKAFTLTCDPSESNQRLGWQAIAGLGEIIERLIVIQSQKLVSAAH